MIATFDLSRVLGWTKSAAADVIKWIALRTLLIGAVGTLVPLAIYKGWLFIQEKLMTFLSSQMNGDFWTGSIVELTGLAAWLANLMRFQECFMLLATALTFRFVLGFFRR